MTPSNSAHDDSLIERAREASKHAHAPYSSFKVGAAIQAGDQTFVGCNVENASYGLTLCAERNAVAAAIVAGAPKMDVIVVYTDTDGPTAPCGACRQVLHEFAPQIRVIMASRNGCQQRNLSDLLPMAFDLTEKR